MTSKKQECFVYMTLPGQTDQITAGKYVLEKTEQGIDVGHFVYGRSYLSRADAVEIDPIELKLENKVFTTLKLLSFIKIFRFDYFNVATPSIEVPVHLSCAAGSELNC